MKNRSLYAVAIREEVTRMGFPDIDPRHVEGFMRLEHSVLSGLSAGQFTDEVQVAVECIQTGGVENAEALALTFAL